MPLNLDERYSRQVLFPPIGREGQHRLGTAKVAVIGCGATGSAVVSLLARAGVGELRIIDRDYVEPATCSASPCLTKQTRASHCPRLWRRPAR